MYMYVKLVHAIHVLVSQLHCVYLHVHVCSELVAAKWLLGCVHFYNPPLQGRNVHNRSLSLSVCLSVFDSLDDVGCFCVCCLCSMRVYVSVCTHMFVFSDEVCACSLTLTSAHPLPLLPFLTLSPLLPQSLSIPPSAPFLSLSRSLSPFLHFSPSLSRSMSYIIMACIAPVSLPSTHNTLPTFN